MPFLQGDTDTVFEFATGLLRGTQWLVELAVCQSPCCPCVACESTWSHVVATETADEPHRFWLDLGERGLARPPTDKEAPFAEAFLAQATAADWEHLLGQFGAAKQALCEDIDLTAVDADFEFAKIEDTGLLVAYNDIFPFHQPLRPILGGQSFIVMDAYCLVPGCDCQEVHLSFCADDPPGPDGEATASEVFAVTVNLAQRTWKLSRETGPTPVPAATMVAEFLAHVDAYAIFPERQRVLRALYRHNRHKFVPEPFRAAAKVGRNDPCPCGSGRKYKKCCMDKPT